MATVIGIAGSPRKQGNSATLMRAVLSGAAKHGLSTEEVYLNGLEFRGCQGCKQCRGGGACILDDGLTPHLRSLRSAAGWVLATPIYYDGCTGQLKSFFDRCRTLTHDPDSGALVPQLSGSRRAVIVATYEDHGRDEYRQSMDVLARYLSWMGDFGRVEVLCEGSLGPPDAARRRPDLISKAVSIGEEVYSDIG